jgi:hypothetical protein
LLELSPVERNSVNFEAELSAALATEIEVRKADAELLVDLRVQSVASLALILDQIGCLFPQLRLNFRESGVGVGAKVENLPGSRVVDSDLRLELPLKVRQERVVELVILAELCLDLSGIPGGEEVLKVVELEGVRFVLEGVDGDFVEDDSLFQQQEADVHQAIACRPEDVPLLGQVPELPARVHDEHDDFLLVDVALSGLVHDSLLLLL